MSQDLRSFVAAYGRAHPDEVVRVAEPVSIAYDVMALVLEYERRRRFPILMFDTVAGYDIPIVTNVVASRRALAFALGERERAAAGDDVRDDRDVVPGDRVEHQDREAAPPLVFEDQRHHVVRDRDGLGDADHLVRVGAPVRGDETPEILAHPRTRPAVSSACTAARRASRAAA